MNYKALLSVFFLLTTFFASAQDWETDLKEAKETAQKDHRKIILVFEGSDWCAPCIKLEKNIWSTDEFEDYADDHFVMLKADFPRRKKNQLSPEQQEKNNQLAKTYNEHGYFPFVVVLDENGNVLGKTGYKDVSPKEYIDLLNSFKS